MSIRTGTRGDLSEWVPEVVKMSWPYSSARAASGCKLDNLAARREVFVRPGCNPYYMNGVPSLVFFVYAGTNAHDSAIAM